MPSRATPPVPCRRGPAHCDALERRTLFTTAALLADLDTAATTANLTPGVVVGNVLYAGRAGPKYGELWRTDGTAAGTRRLLTLADDIPPQHLVAFGTGVAYTSDAAVYVYDIASGDTRLVLPHASTANGAASDEASMTLATVGGRLWIATSGGLYASDGTAAGTVQVVAATNASVPRFETAAGAYYFTQGYTTVSTPSTVYRSDGTAAGTVAVANGAITSLGLAGQTVVYESQPTLNGGTVGLYALGGDAPTLIHTFDYGQSESGAGASLGGAYYFGAPPAASGYHTLWRTDGTAAGTTEVLASGTTYSTGPLDIRAGGGRLFYRTQDGEDASTSLWSSDGTAAGTVQVATYSGVGGNTVISGGVYLSAPSVSAAGVAFATVTFGTIYNFGNATNPKPPLLVRSDGTTAGTTQVGVGPANTALFSTPVPDDAGGVWVTERDFVEAVGTLWRAADATPGSAAPFAPGGTELSASDPTGVIGGSPVSYFQAPVTGGTTDYLWRTDGTAAGTFAVADATAPYAATATFLAGDQLIFTSNHTTGVNLYRTDGTAAGTYGLLPVDSRVTLYEGEPAFFSDGGAGAYFLAYSAATSSTGLWHTDGTASGTAVVEPLPFALDGDVSGATLGGRFYFSGGGVDVASNPAAMARSILYVTDGTAAGTTPFFTPPVGDGAIAALTPFAGRLFFKTTAGLYATDGTAAGTVQLAGLPTDTYVTASAGAGSELYFTENDQHLWKTDGTAAGTVQVFDATTVGTDSSISQLTSVGGRSYFTMFDAAHGTELWSSDGTPAGTALLCDTNPGPASGGPAQLTAAGGQLVFTADDGVNGRELWASDGTSADTTVAVDIDPGPTPSDPAGLSATGDGRVLFAADDGTHGTELWQATAGTATPTPTPTPTAATTLAVITSVTGRPAAVGGAKGVARVTITEAGSATVSEAATIQLLLSTTPTADAGTTTPLTSARIVLKLKPGQRRTATPIRFTYPAGTDDGTRYVVAVVDAASGASAAIAYRHASVDLSATAAAAKGRAGRRARVVLQVHNAGSVNTAGAASFAATLTGGSLASAVTLPVVVRRVSVRAGATTAVAVPVTVPAGVAVGSYALTVRVTPPANPWNGAVADAVVVVPFTVV